MVVSSMASPEGALVVLVIGGPFAAGSAAFFVEVVAAGRLLVMVRVRHRTAQPAECQTPAAAPLAPRPLVGAASASSVVMVTIVIVLVTTADVGVVVGLRRIRIQRQSTSSAHDRRR